MPNLGVGDKEEVATEPVSLLGRFNSKFNLIVPMIILHVHGDLLKAITFDLQMRVVGGGNQASESRQEHKHRVHTWGRPVLMARWE